MTGYLYALLGAGLLLLTWVDVLLTVLVIGGGGGPISVYGMRWLWRSALAVHHRRACHRLLRLAGYGILILTIAVWVLLLFTGWFFIFSIRSDSVVDTQTGHAADWWSRGYFAGFSMITLGTGDFRPVGGFYQMASVAAACTGFALMTLTITYLLGVVEAATAKRQLALRLAALGHTPQELLLTHWDGASFSKFEQTLRELSPAVALLTQREQAYPILHYLHTTRVTSAVEVRLAVLCEALHLLDTAVDAKVRPDSLQSCAMAYMFKEYLRNVGGTGLYRDATVPPAPAVERLGAAGVPLRDEQEYLEALSRHAPTRRLLHGLVLADGWDWRAVEGSG